MTTLSGDKQALEAENYPNPNTVPMHLLERVFWNRKLPRSMLFYLKCISRELMLNGDPANYLQQAAEFFENLMKHRDVELTNLPMLSYLDKLIKKLGLQGPPAAAFPGNKQPDALLNPVKCTRCGRWLNPKAQRPAGTAPSADYVVTHVEGDSTCTIIALPSPGPDAFGRFLYHDVVGTGSQQDQIATRSLAAIMDY